MGSEYRRARRDHIVLCRRLTGLFPKFFIAHLIRMFSIITFLFTDFKKKKNKWREVSLRVAIGA